MKILYLIKSKEQIEEVLFTSREYAVNYAKVQWRDDTDVRIIEMKYDDSDEYSTLNLKDMDTSEETIDAYRRHMGAMWLVDQSSDEPL